MSQPSYRGVVFGCRPNQGADLAMRIMPNGALEKALRILRSAMRRARAKNQLIELNDEWFMLLTDPGATMVYFIYAPAEGVTDTQASNLMQQTSSTTAYPLPWNTDKAAIRAMPVQPPGPIRRFFF